MRAHADPSIRALWMAHYAARVAGYSILIGALACVALCLGFSIAILGAMYLAV